ncbi:MAG: hypothetical protein OXC07_07330 [Kistimonas sp.]|nr:hypothetical protein [Kistimonas sp.]
MGNFSELAVDVGKNKDFYLTSDDRQVGRYALEFLREHVGDLSRGYRIPETIKNRSQLWLSFKGACGPLHQDLINNMSAQVNSMKGLISIHFIQEQYLCDNPGEQRDIFSMESMHIFYKDKNLPLYPSGDRFM